MRASVGILIFLSFSFLIGCQNTPCRDTHRNKAQPVESGTENPNKNLDDTFVTPPNGAAMLKVKIYKPDGSLQCNMGKKISLEAMEKELSGITVYSRSNRNDGLIRIQVCGAPTGNSNVFEISRNDLEKALKLGFKEWTFE